MNWTPLLLSLQIASIAMVLSLVVGTGLALLLGWKKLPARDFVDAIVSAPLVLPPTVLGYYLFTMIGPQSGVGRAWHWLTGDDLVFTFKAAVIAATVGSLPLVVRSGRGRCACSQPCACRAPRLGSRPARCAAWRARWAITA